MRSMVEREPQAVDKLSSEFSLNDGASLSTSLRLVPLSQEGEDGC